jgi:hypothetical protein
MPNSRVGCSVRCSASLEERGGSLPAASARNASERSSFSRGVRRSAPTVDPGISYPSPASRGTRDPARRTGRSIARPRTEPQAGPRPSSRRDSAGRRFGASPRPCGFRCMGRPFRSRREVPPAIRCVRCTASTWTDLLESLRRIGRTIATQLSYGTSQMVVGRTGLASLRADVVRVEDLPAAAHDLDGLGYLRAEEYADVVADPLGHASCRLDEVEGELAAVRQRDAR